MADNPLPPPLSFYLRAPTLAIELDEVERLGLLRLQVLCALNPASRGGGNDSEAALRAFRELLASSSASDACARDTASHYALRLAFCRTRELIEWLADAETALFGLHLRHRMQREAIDVLAREGIVYVTCVRDSSVHYIVPFQHASPLVRRRSVHMHGGVCFVSLQHMAVVAQHHFRIALTQQLYVLQRSLPANPYAPATLARLETTFERFITYSHRHHNQHTTTSSQLRVTPLNIDVVALTHFPLCMRSLHRAFRLAHHLKYDGRVQYRLFLKGIGWSVGETLLYFRSEFVRVMAPAVFDREHAYAIRHSYGLEGARKDYKALDCQQIIYGAVPRTGQHHGCPFRHWDATHLRAELHQQGSSSNSNSSNRTSRVTPAVAQEIADQSSRGDYQGACQRFFDVTHSSSYAEVVVGTMHPQQQQDGSSYGKAALTARVSHPNAWLDASLRTATG